MLYLFKVHRRLTHDDAFGVGEALNETAFGVGLVARGSHFVTTGGLAQVRLLMQEKVLNSWIFFNRVNGISFDDWKDSFNMEVCCSTIPFILKRQTAIPNIFK